uniref:Uncharacterized protein n=1 Tax=Oryza glumipatula TaxID=40148 RepID=A0A0D9Z2L9_9ORYZ
MAATSSLASSHLADLHRAGGASPSPLPRRIRSSSASGALAAARSASSPWPDPARLPSSVLLKPAIQASDAVLEVVSELGFLDTATATSRGLPSAVVLPGRKGKYYLCYASSSRILSHPRSTSELVAGDGVLRRDLDTGDHPVAASSTPKLVAGAAAITTQDPPPSTPHAGARRLRRLCHHADPPPSMRPCPTPELASGRVLHAGARRRCRRHHHAGSSAVHAPRWSSSPAPSLSPRRILRRPCDHAPCRSSPVVASSTLELVAGSRVRAADVSLIYAAPIVAFVLASEGGGQGAIPLGQYPNGIPVYSSSLFKYRKNSNSLTQSQSSETL